jgi:hypothetical protein
MEYGNFDGIQKILMACRNVMLGAVHFSPIPFFKLSYYGITFTVKDFCMNVF